MRVSSTRSGNRIRIVDGVMDDGRIVSREVTSYHDAGAYSALAVRGHQARPTRRAVHDPQRLDRRVLLHQPAAVERVPGSASPRRRSRPRCRWIASRAIGVDPWELRLKNAYRDGDERPYRKIVEDATLVETIRAAAELVGHDLPNSTDAASRRSDYPTGMNLGGDPTQVSSTPPRSATSSSRCPRSTSGRA